MKAFPHFLISISFYLLPVSFTQFAFAQTSQINSIKNIIQTLSSDSLWGRSIHKNGKIKAKNWLIEILKEQSQDSFEIKTVQFDTTFNYISKTHLNKSAYTLTPGIDYLVDGTAPQTLLNGKLTGLNSAISKSDLFSLLKAQSNFDKLFLIKQELNSSPTLSTSDIISILYSFGAKAIFIESEFLSFGPSSFQYPFPIIYVSKNVLNHDDIVSLYIESNIVSYPVETIVANYTKQNETSQNRITLMAHYDHLGTLNDSLIYNGANDNASGVGLAIELFGSLIKKGISAQLLLTDAEEIGLIGSAHLANSTELKPISFLLNLDMIGSSKNGIGVVGGLDIPELSSILQKHTEKQSIHVKNRKNAPNSDHYWFLKNGTRGFYIYSNEGKQPYHQFKDISETLDYSFIEILFPVLEAFLVEVQTVLN